MSQRVRLRQAVFVADELEPLCGELERELGVTDPFHDPGVGEFGLRNAVYALGDCFLEVIAPVQAETAAGRYIERFGAGGYMVLFDLEDLDAARARVERLGVRVVWRIDLPDIAGTHLHPADMAGAIVSLDRSEPYGTWRWGGPAWAGQVGEGAPGALNAITVAVGDPGAAAARWSEVLGVERGEGQALQLDGGAVRFREPAPGGRRGLVEIDVSAPGGAREIELGGVLLRIG
ncbi:MAG TPA: VOC family protein [Solirubrobacteraceae bacterium]|jgi:hypothetical protein